MYLFQKLGVVSGQKRISRCQVDHLPVIHIGGVLTSTASTVISAVTDLDAAAPHTTTTTHHKSLRMIFNISDLLSQPRAREQSFR